MPFKAWKRRAVYFITSTFTSNGFPALIDETNVPADFFSEVQNGGGDIRVAQIDSRGFQVRDHEVVYCDTGTNTLQLWIDISDLGKEIFLYYGNPNVTSTSTSDTWQTQFQQVYHLEETAGQFIDATSNSSDTTSVNGTLPNPTPSIVGDGQDFNGTSDFAQFNRTFSGECTMEAWVTTTQTAPTGTQWFEGAAIIDGSDPAVGVQDIGMSMIEAGSVGVLCVGVGNPDTTLIGTTQINDGNVHHCAFNRNATTGNVRLFVDGVEDVNGFLTSGNLNGSNTFTIGRTHLRTPTIFFDGIIDELRTIDDAKFPSWIADTFLSIDDPSAFLVFQPQLST